MDKNLIPQAIEDALQRRGCFLVDASVSRDNDITVTIEKDEGSVDLDDCEAVNDAFLAAFDRDAEDYSLTVTSAGLDQPFKVQRQFQKALGSEVEVRLKGGRKLVGILHDADNEGITLIYSQKETVEGKKRKELVEHRDRFGFEEVNSVIPFVRFE